MSSRFLYFYLMRDEPDVIRDVAPQHAQYWRDLDLPGYLGGPFADRSGGSISFEIAGLDEAEVLVAEDPFVTADVISGSWLKEWNLE